MAALLWVDVISMSGATEACSVDTHAQTVILDIINGTSGPDPALFLNGESSPKLRLMRALMAAHIAVTSPIGVSGGAVTSESAGALARSYASPTRALYQESSYGRLYWEMLQGTTARVGFVVTWGC